MERQDKVLMVSADAVTEAEKEGKKKLRKEQWKNFWQKGFMLIVIIVLIILLLAKCDSGGFRTPVVDEPEIGTEQSTNNDPTFSTEQSDKLHEGTDIGKSKEEIQKELNEKVKASYILIECQPSVTFENGTSEGYMGIINKKHELNTRPVVVQWFLLEEKVDADGNKTMVEGQKIYESGVIPLDTSIVYDTLDVNLPKGDYSANVYYIALNEDNSYFGHQKVGNLKIKVLN